MGIVSSGDVTMGDNVVSVEVVEVLLVDSTLFGFGGKSVPFVWRYCLYINVVFGIFRIVLQFV